MEIYFILPRMQTLCRLKSLIYLYFPTANLVPGILAIINNIQLFFNGVFTLQLILNCWISGTVYMHTEFINILVWPYLKRVVWIRINEIWMLLTLISIVGTLLKWLADLYCSNGRGNCYNWTLFKVSDRQCMVVELILQYCREIF